MAVDDKPKWTGSPGEYPYLLSAEEEAEARAWGRRAAFWTIAASLLITFGPIGLLYLWSCP